MAAKENNVETTQVGDVVVMDADFSTVENTRKLKLVKVYSFEGKTYDSIDLSGISNLTAMDMARAEKMVVNEGISTNTAETNMYYVMHIASAATGIPVEFFYQLGTKDAYHLKNAVTAFLLVLD